MSLSVFEIAGRASVIGIGKGCVGGVTETFRATLGSCVGVCIAWPKQAVFGFAHVLLPSAKDPQEVAKTKDGSRYANSVVSWILHQLEVPARRRRELVAYVAGGARMFTGESQQTHVGEMNEENLLSALALEKVRVKARDFGGEEGRQMIVDGETRSVYVTSLEGGEPLHWELPPTFGVNLNG